MINIEVNKIWRSHMPLYIFACYVVIVFMHSIGTSWTGFLSLRLTWFTILIGCVGFEIMTTWVFGREFQDETFKELLALPISRTRIVFAKIGALLIFEVSLVLAALALLLGVGLVLGLSGLTVAVTLPLLGHFLLAMLAAILLSLLFPLVTCVMHGLLVPLSSAFGLLIVGRLLMPQPIGKFFPSAIPMLLANQSPAINWGSWLVMVIVGVVGLCGTIYWWNKADHND